jgi:hypothetical protein
MDIEAEDAEEGAKLTAEWTAHLQTLQNQAILLQSIGGQAIQQFGQAFTSAFANAILSGDNFAQAMGQILKQMVAQMLAAAAAAALLTALFPGFAAAKGGFKGLFGGFSGLGSIGGTGNFNLNGAGALGGFRLQGNDLSTSVFRTNVIRNRYD